MWQLRPPPRTGCDTVRRPLPNLRKWNVRRQPRTPRPAINTSSVSTRPIATNKHNIQKIRSALPGEGLAFEEASPARSMAPTTPTNAASNAPARRKFRPMSEENLKAGLFQRGVLLKGFEQLFEDGRSTERAKYDPGIVRASARTIPAPTALGALPCRIWAMAWRISAGWRLRNRDISAAVTGKVDMYSRTANNRDTISVNPKVQRHDISAMTNEGRRNSIRKPSSVGDRRFIVR